MQTLSLGDYLTTIFLRTSANCHSIPTSLCWRRTLAKIETTYMRLWHEVTSCAVVGQMSRLKSVGVFIMFMISSTLQKRSWKNLKLLLFRAHQLQSSMTKTPGSSTLWTLSKRLWTNTGKYGFSAFVLVTRLSLRLSVESAKRCHREVYKLARNK